MRRLVLTALALLLACAQVRAEPVTPLPHTHAHNDYQHPHPLFDALAHGFTSVEADVCLVDGKLLVAHDVSATRPERSLQALYLDPLRARVRAQGGVYPHFARGFQLLIDVKTDADATYRALAPLLARYAEMLTRWSARGVRAGAITVVISGNSARSLMATDALRYAACDGRRADLDGRAPAALVPLISERWGSLFSWQGAGPMPKADRDALRAFVQTAHAHHQRVRFWETPEADGARERVWNELLEDGVDYLNTDQLDALRVFMRQRTAQR